MNFDRKFIFNTPQKVKLLNDLMDAALKYAIADSELASYCYKNDPYASVLQTTIISLKSKGKDPSISHVPEAVRVGETLSIAINLIEKLVNEGVPQVVCAELIRRLLAPNSDSYGVNIV